MSTQFCEVNEHELTAIEGGWLRQVVSAFRTGWKVGTRLDNALDLSDKISDYAYEKVHGKD